jgi:hypothetical protein
MQKQPWWQQEVSIAWALILFFPLGLWLMWKYAPWRNRFKWIWTGVTPFAALMIVAAAIPSQDNENSVSNGVLSTPAIAATSAAAPPPTSAAAYKTVASPPTSAAAATSTVAPQPTATPQPPKPTATPKPAKITNTAPLAIRAVAEGGGVRITIVDIRDQWPCDWPTPGMRCVAFEVTVENVSNSQIFVNPMRFKLTDNDSFQYEWELSAAPEPWVGGQVLEAGTKTQGFLGFEPRQDALLRELYYDPDIHFLAQ